MFKSSKEEGAAGGKTLLLLRHAEAEQNTPDKDRKLTPAGKAAARKLGLMMRERKIKPDLIYCSTARRAQETAVDLGLPSRLEYEDELYNATAEQIFAVAQRAGKAQSLLIVGHNPGIHTLAAGLAGRGEAQLLRTLNASFPPATLAMFSFSGEWRQLAPKAATLSGLIFTV